MPKKQGLEQCADLGEWLGKKERGGVFEGGGLIPQWTLCCVMVLIIRTKQHFPMPFCYLLSVNVSEQSCPRQAIKISNYILWVWLLILFSYLECKQMA